MDVPESHLLTISYHIHLQLANLWIDILCNPLYNIAKSTLEKEETTGYFLVLSPHLRHSTPLYHTGGIYANQETGRRTQLQGPKTR